MFYGPQTPGTPNLTETSVVFSVDQGGGGDFTTITAAMGAAISGVVVLVEPGTYNESINLVDGVELVGNGSSSDQVIIVGDGVTRAVTANGVGNATLVRGLSIRSSAGGMEITNASPVLKNVWFVENETAAPKGKQAGNGAGVVIDGGTPTFSGCIFRNGNTPGVGGAAQILSGNPNFSFCLFVGNSAGVDGGAVHQSGGVSLFDNCVFDLNAAYGTQGGTVHVTGGDLTASFSALTNGQAGAPIRNTGVGSVELSCGVINGFSVNTPGGDVIAMNDVLEGQDPQFCQPLAFNYSYPESSPLFGLACGDPIGVAGPPCGQILTSNEPVSVATKRMVLHPPIPNPFNPATTLRFELSRAGRVRLEIFDVRGRMVASPVADVQYGSGVHEVVWRGLDAGQQRVASGVYFARMKVDGQHAETVQRMVLLK